MIESVLEHATWVFDLEEDPFFKGKIIYVKGCTWENCVGEDISEACACILWGEQKVTRQFV